MEGKEKKRGRLCTQSLGSTLHFRIPKVKPLGFAFAMTVVPVDLGTQDILPRPRVGPWARGCGREGLLALSACPPALPPPRPRYAQRPRPVHDRKTGRSAGPILPAQAACEALRDRPRQCLLITSLGPFKQCLGKQADLQGMLQGP